MTKRDRLTAFLDAFPLTITLVHLGSDAAEPNLFVHIPQGSPHASRITFFARGGPFPSPADGDVIAVATGLGGSRNPLANALPDCLVFQLEEEPALQGVADLFVMEARKGQCGSQVVLSRLAEVMVLIALRRAIGRNPAGPGLLAGLAHPALHHAIVAMHDAPAHAWYVDDLAALAGMSRSHFIAQFRAVTGASPGAYLAAWRLTLAYQRLLKGGTVKSVARQVGFGSAEAFSRAFSRRFGCAPTAVS